MAYSSVVIIGAPRSGTNMLRDMLVKLPGAGTWPCDEINYIWRHGNIRYPSDEFTPEMGTARIQSYIRRQFDKIAREYALDTVIEKTCANSLRVGFVDKIIPEAKYVFIVRDGVDAAGSALKRWKAELDIPYVLRKARYVPITDFPYYASRYLFNHFHRLVSRESRLSFWGPAMADIDELLAGYSLPEVCALQWKACVENSERDFSFIDPNNIYRLRYEDFVKEPVEEFTRVAKFINKRVPEFVVDHLNKSIKQSSVGKGRAALGEISVAKIKPLIADTLQKYGYE